MAEQGSVALTAGDRITSESGHRLLLWTLLIVYILNFLDRQIVNILAEPISRDLGLSDTQIGLMTGLAFALFYTVLGIPIARYADRPGTNRSLIIAVSLAIWSAMTALCGMAQNFVQLLLARIGVGVGEAGCTPAAHSLIADAVPPERRSSAIAFYGLGIPIGGLIGSLGGGLLSDNFGWRTAFLVVGVPGLLVAMALPFVLREPRLAQRNAAVVGEHPPALSFKEALGEVLGSRAFVLLAIAASLTAFLAYGKGVWVTILYMRDFGLSATETGFWFGTISSVMAAIGTWAGGALADHFGAKDKKYILYAPAIGMVIAAPLLFMAYWTTDWRLSVALLALPTMLNYFYYGPCYASAQGLVRKEARAVASSIMVFGQNLIGLGLGPMFFGMLSDAFRPMAGDQSVRWVLYGAAWLGLIPALFFWLASKRLAQDLKSG